MNNKFDIAQSKFNLSLASPHRTERQSRLFKHKTKIEIRPKQRNNDKGEFYII